MGSGSVELGQSFFIVLLFLLFLLFFLRDEKTKRRLLSCFVILGGLASVMFVVTTGTQAGIAIIFIASVMLASYLNFRRFQFCKECGATIYNHWFRAKHCPKCGAKLRN